MTTPWEQGPGRVPHSENLAAYERAVARQLEQLALQVTPQTVLQVRNGFLGEAQRLQDALRHHAANIVVGPVGGDPLSQPAANVFNEHIKFTLAKCQAYVNQLRTQGDKLSQTARSYGHTEQEIKQSFERHVKARQQEWRDVQEGHDRIARLPGLQREILDPPPAPPPPPEGGQNLPKGPS
ncbi:hypothetical protein GCM10023321_72870 [Pseudonocardia eucalypti]|uniref:PE family protein n=1 Tax=Pseudonocardia eucalypti TaxID=648755 RepID=A0ABP9R799_9PSEU|nr:plasmid stabilization system protein ParE [Pseudonocardia eucalypti]